MTQVWEREDLDPYERLVMLSLADHANDDGVCYPSIARLCKRTGMKERGVQTVIKRLVSKGFISIEMQAGKKGANLYTVRSTPAPDAPPHDMPPASHVDAPPHPMRSTPAPDAPEPSITTNEPSDPPVGPPDDAKPVKARLPDDWTPDDDCLAYAHSLQLHDSEIREIADDFHAYWTDRTDSGGRKSQRGWRQAWRNRCRDVAPKFKRNRVVAGNSGPSGYGQSGSIASIAARRRASGAV